MIKSRRDLSVYLAADLKSSEISKWRIYDRWRHPVLHFQRRLRKTEYTVNCFKGPIWAAYRLYSKMRLRNHGIKLGFTIYPNCFGPGLSIAHWGTIVINPDSRIGANCRIHPGTCLGWYKGGVPTLGDNCYLGPGSKVFGSVILGDSTRVGANAVVNRSYTSGHVTLVGAPAKPTNHPIIEQTKKVESGPGFASPSHNYPQVVAPLTN